MATAAQIMANFGLVNTDAIVQAAQLEGIDLAAAAAMMSKESSGRNVWGSDGVSTGGAYVKGSPVTEAAYLKYRALVRAGKIGRQGVGPAQCTSASYQDVADQLGGCWLLVPNMRSGFRGLQRLIKAYGIQQGARRYNGSGPAAEAYGRDFAARYATWKARLAGASVPAPAPSEEDDMTDAERDMLKDVHDALPMLRDMWSQFAGHAAQPGQFTGWPALDGGSAVDPLTLVDWCRHNDVSLVALKSQLDGMVAQVDSVMKQN